MLLADAALPRENLSLEKQCLATPAVLPRHTPVAKCQHQSSAVKKHCSLAPFEEARKVYNDEDIFFIGGEQIYSAAVAFCDTAYITKIDNEYDADRFLVDFDNLDGWHIKSEEMIKTKKGVYITFTTYIRD